MTLCRGERQSRCGWPAPAFAQPAPLMRLVRPNQPGAASASLQSSSGGAPFFTASMKRSVIASIASTGSSAMGQTLRSECQLRPDGIWPGQPTHCAELVMWRYRLGAADSTTRQRDDLPQKPRVRTNSHALPPHVAVSLSSSKLGIQGASLGRSVKNETPPSGRSIHSTTG